MIRFIAIAAVALVSTSAAAQPAKSKAHVPATARPAAVNVNVIDNIIARVQMDALIGEIVADGGEPLPAARSTTVYASTDRPLVRNRS